MKKTFYIIFILLPFLISCEKIIEFDSEIKEPKIVINSLFESENFWEVQVSSSLSINDTARLSNLKNASVLILDNQNNLIETLSYDTLGYYYGSKTPIAGQKYSIEVSSINFKTALATDSIPIKTTITKVDTNSYIQNDNSRLNIDLRFNDSLLINNYYKIAVRIGREKFIIRNDTNGLDYIDTNYKEKWVNLKTESNFIETTTNSKELIFNDNLFNGFEATASFSIKNLFKKDQEDENYNLKFVTIYLYGISRGHYNFYKSMKIYNENSTNIFAQPIQVYSNVSNGHGVFIGAQPNEYQLY